MKRAEIFFNGIASIGVALVLGCTAMAAVQAIAGAVGTSNATVPGSSGLIGVRARLQKNLDAKKVKPGDAIVATPEARMHIAEGIDLDGGSMLVGHVDKVQPSVNGGDSAISMTFDKLRLKDAREIEIKATILWIGEAPNSLIPTVVSAPADRTTPGVGVNAGNSQMPPAQGYQGSEITGGPARNGKRPGGGTAPELPAGISMQKDAIPGVNFFSDMGRDDSGWLRSRRRNVYVPGGTVLAVAIVVLPSGGAKP